MLSEAQQQKISLLSDTVLYPEAVAFIRKLVDEQDCSPLPTTQVKGLQSIAESYQFNELHRYIVHQFERNWPDSKSSIKTLYIELDRLFTTMKNKRLRDEFHLMGEERGSREARAMEDALMAALAREFIQHMVAENGLLELEEKQRRAREQRERTANRGGNRQ
ncbi:MAG TPA: hypothetical protein VKV20_04595 [Ktedonobacteraceae bacterium]|jgi:hypothetical protein|nr:hypothetical protein [Ktedonobacteraceae bacterium]